MNNRLYVGNLPREVTAAELEGLFTHFGKVRSASVVTVVNAAREEASRYSRRR